MFKQSKVGNGDGREETPLLSMLYPQELPTLTRIKLVRQIINSWGKELEKGKFNLEISIDHYSGYDLWKY